MNGLKLVEYAFSFIALYVTVFFLLLFVRYRKTVPVEPEATDWTPKLSVVIPAYNEERNLRRCIDSVLNADYPREKLEIIVVDDSSTDSTYEIAKSYEKLGVKAYRKENEGTAASTKNYGIRRCTGELVATLDADSYIRKDTIRKMIKHFQSEDIAAVTAAIKADEERGKNALVVIQKVEYLFTLFSRKVLTFIDAVQVTPGPFSMFRRWVFEKIGYFENKSIAEDQELAMRIQQNNYKIRSSLEAEVYTEVPKDFGSLLKQRIRWHRGGLHNSIKYLNMIGPHYGDFGLVIMPLTFLSIIGIVGLLVISSANYLENQKYVELLGAEAIIMTFNPIHVIMGFVVLLNLIWILWGIYLFRKERLSMLSIFIYIIGYSYLVVFYWIAALLKELKGEKLAW
ncbi:glycosyltransferase family 2 protein [Candidatus Micrarchaeota archaeon]|nr:glycosyltransferase family 2 protein [Candidatus Micrarchaeota archaeon]